MRRLCVLPVLIGLLAAMTSATTAWGSVVVDMPPPPPTETEAPAAAADGEPAADLGDIALMRYGHRRSLSVMTHGPRWGWGRGYRGWGWGGGWGPFIGGGYRISLSPWTHFGHRNYWDHYVWPAGLHGGFHHGPFMGFRP